MGKGTLVKQPKKVYKNSHCDICDCFMCEVKLKINPNTNEKIIICKDCWINLVKENKANGI
jgi:hypothetical protein